MPLAGRKASFLLFSILFSLFPNSINRRKGSEEDETLLTYHLCSGSFIQQIISAHLGQKPKSPYSGLDLH